MIINDKYEDMYNKRGIDIFGSDDYVNDRCQVYTDPNNLTAYSNTYKKNI